MPALFDDSVLDAALNVIASGNALHICSGTPATRATVISQSLATVALDAADFALSNDEVSGRQVTVAAQNGVPVTAAGTPLHYCIINATVLLARTEVDPASPNLTTGSTTDIPTTQFEIADPVVV